MRRATSVCMTTMKLITANGIQDIPDVSPKVKSIKCTKCHCMISPDMDLLNRTIAECAHNKRRSHIKCGLIQTKEFIERMDKKAKGEKKLPVLLLQSFGKKDEPAQNEDADTLVVPDPLAIFIDKRGEVTILDSE